MLQATPPLLDLRNVDVVFDGIVQVLRSVNLEVRPGKVTALLGGNGAGKTTTLKAISGLLAVEHGRVTEPHLVAQIRGEKKDDPFLASSILVTLSAVEAAETGSQGIIPT